MKNFKDIIENYEKGDSETRLNLYLEHRILRKEFENIDRDDLIHLRKYNQKLCKNTMTEQP